MKHIIVCAFFYCISSLASKGFSQTNRADSLLRIMYAAKTDQQKLKAALAICEDYKAISRDTLDHYSFYARELAQKTNNKKLKDLSELAVAADYLRWGWSDSVLITVAPVINTNNAANAEDRAVLFKAMRLKAMSYATKSRFQEGLEVFYKIVNEAEKWKDTLTYCENTNSIGSIALARDKPREALAWLSRSYSLTTGDPDYINVRAAISVNTADAYKQLSKNDSADYYIKKGISLFKETENLSDLAIALQKQSAIYLAAGRINDAENSLKELISLRKVAGDSAVYLDDNLSLIDFYIQTKQIDKAITFCESALATGDLHSNNNGGPQTFTNNINTRLEYYTVLAKLYKMKGYHKEYMQTLEHIIQAKDSFYQYNSAKAIAEIQTKYEVQKKENTIIQQRLSITNKNNRFYTLLGIAFFTTAILAVWFIGYRKREKDKLKAILENEKASSAQSVAKAEENERKRIAADLHDNLGAFAASILSNLDFIKPNAENQSVTAVQELRNNSQAMVAQLNDTIWALKKDALPLTAISDRLKSFIQRIEASYPNVAINVVERIEQDFTLSPAHAFHLFRISQEAINNALKHSRAHEIMVVIQSSNIKWEVSITDDGTGMNADDTKGNGLFNMRERAKEGGWNIEWQSKESSGTRVLISPLNENIS